MCHARHGMRPGKSKPINDAAWIIRQKSHIVAASVQRTRQVKGMKPAVDGDIDFEWSI